MALNDIKVPKENASGTFDEVVLTPAQIGAVSTSDSRLSDSRTPTPHTHTAADIDSESADAGYVLTADGEGGASWQSGAVDAVQSISGVNEVTLDAALYNTFVVEVSEPTVFSFENFPTGRSINVYLDAAHSGAILHTFPIETHFAELGNNNTVYTFEGYTTRVLVQNIGSRIMTFSEILPMAGSPYYYYYGGGDEDGGVIGLELLMEL
jgi:hypothetical protein